jgi:Protein of unknown function (DUF1579)
MSDTGCETAGGGPPKPGAQHALLKPFVGTFKSIVRIWMGPGNPMESTGTMASDFQVDGLYLHQNYTGDPNEGPFPNFCGRGYWGFNFATGKYEGFWIDNASPMMQMETGDVDNAGKVWTMLSEMVNPQTGDPMTKKSVISLIDDDHHSMQMYFVGPDGNEFKGMEIQYTRA